MLYELPKNLIVVIKNCIIQVGLGNIPPELTSLNLELEKIPAEHQIKFFMTTKNFCLPKNLWMLLQGIVIIFI